MRGKSRSLAFLSVATLAAVTLAALFGGQRYFYCHAMGEIMEPTTCACARTPSHDEDRTTVGALNDCFEVRFLDRLVSFTIGDDVSVPAASVMAMLPPNTSVMPASASPRRADHPIRAGPFSPTASRAQLMVFLT